MSASTSALSKPRNVVRNRAWRRSRGLTFMRSPAGGSNVALPKDGRAEPHDRGSFLHGNFEIVTHTHRQFPQQRGVETLFQQRGAKVPELREVRPRTLGMLEQRGNRHQPDTACRTAARRGSDDVHRLVRSRSMLGCLPREVDLDEQLGCGPCLGRSGVDRLEEPPAVYGMDGTEARDGLPNLVRLQRADQMPSDLKFGRSFDLL